MWSSDRGAGFQRDMGLLPEAGGGALPPDQARLGALARLPAASFPGASPPCAANTVSRLSR